MFPSTTNILSSALAMGSLFAIGTQAAKCEVVGVTYSQDRPISGGSGLSELLMYKDGNHDKPFATYSGDYDPNCCIGSDRTTDFFSPLPYDFVYTAHMHPSGLTLDGCHGKYAAQTDLVGDANTDISIDFGSSVSSKCVITFDC